MQRGVSLGVLRCDKMDNFDLQDEPVELSPIGRKRKHKKQSYSRAIEKKARHSGGGKVASVACTHRDQKFCNASSFSSDDVAYMHGVLYSTQCKVAQDASLLAYMDITAVKRRRTPKSTEGRSKHRDIAVKYYVVKQTKERVPVCKATFMSIFCVKKDRLSHIAKHWMEKGVAMPENRGGARRVELNAAKRETVRNHITTFTCRASHYARRGAPGRKYLPSDLNVKKMHDLFLLQNHQQISYAFYYSIFMYDFNLGFGHPSKDVCSTCVKHRIKLKDPDLSDEARQNESAMYLLHRRRGRKFYDIMNAVDESFTICFDIMENLVLPKSPIGQTYYARQLYMYVFGVVRHRGRGKPQYKDDIHLFVWLESQNKKDSNMVSSALHHYLTQIADMELSGNSELRLFSDSCFGQNKNINVLSMLFALRKQKFTNLRIEYHFPIRGHSFLPADRVFGRLEQDIRKKDTILLPSEYIEILRKHGNVYVYGDNWQCFDFKTAAASHCSSSRSFKISDARVLEINSDKLGYKQVYSGSFCYHGVLKRGKNWEMFKPELLPMINCVKEAKKTDVEKLLDELGVSNTVREFYNSTLSLNNTGQHDHTEDLVDSSESEA